MKWMSVGTAMSETFLLQTCLLYSLWLSTIPGIGYTNKDELERVFITWYFTYWIQIFTPLN